MILLLAIADHPELDLAVGLDPTVYALVEGGMVAVVAQRSDSTVERTPDAIWRHEELLEALMRQRTILPARYGTLFADESALRSALKRHKAELENNMALVRGRVEVGVRALWRAPDTEEQVPTEASVADCDQSATTALGSGTRYLLTRRSREQRANARQVQGAALVSRMHGALTPHAAASVLETFVTPRQLFSAAYLVEGDQVAAFRERICAVAQDLVNVDLLATGPWPPYSFARLALTIE